VGWVIDFASDHDDRLAGFSQDVGYIIVFGCNPRARVNHKEHCVSLFNRHLRLPSSLRRDAVVRARLDASRIDQSEGSAAPFGLGVKAISRDSRHIVDYGCPRSDDPIEEG
jgi:hypothetical protein